MKVKDVLPKLPKQWRFVERWGDGGLWRNRDNLKVIADAETKDDGKPWLHVSFSRADRLPSYSDIINVKETFIGPDRRAIMVFPRRDRHVNIHPNCLHLFACLEGDGLPDFDYAGASI